jgi:hypothetical protein
MPTVRGIANWAFTNRPDNYEHYTITLDVDEDFISVLRDNKVKAQVKEIEHDKEKEVHDADKTYQFKFTRKDGTPIPPPTVVDSKRNPLPDGLLIGNGSDVIVQYGLIPYDDSGTKRKRIELDAVQVLNLVPYKSDRKLEFGDEDGYSADETGVI